MASTDLLLVGVGIMFCAIQMAISCDERGGGWGGTAKESNDRVREGVGRSIPPSFLHFDSHFYIFHIFKLRIAR